MKRGPEASCRLAWAKGVEKRMWERYTAKLVFAKRLLNEAATVFQLGEAGHKNRRTEKSCRCCDKRRRLEKETTGRSF